MSQKENAVIADALKMEGISEALKKATGIIRYTFLNDYKFRVILQKHKNVLRSIVYACLKHLFLTTEIFLYAPSGKVSHGDIYHVFFGLDFLIDCKHHGMFCNAVNQYEINIFL